MMVVVNRFEESLILVTRTNIDPYYGVLKKFINERTHFSYTTNAVMNGHCTQNAFRLPIKLSIYIKRTLVALFNGEEKLHAS